MPSLALAPGVTHPTAARRAICIVFCASGFDMGIWASQVPRIKAMLSLSDAGVATIVLCFAAGGIVMMPLMGALATRFGGVRAVVAGGLASALSLALLGIATRFPTLLAASLFAGIAIGGLDVAMNTQATIVERAWSAPIMSGIHGWFSAGGLAGASVGGALTGMDYRFRTILFVAAIVELIAILGVARWLGVAGRPAGGAGFAWPRPAVAVIGLLCLFAFLFEGAVFDWTGVYMHEVAGTSLGFASAAFAGFSLAMAATRFAGDFFVRRLGPMRVLTGGGTLAACGIALACAAPHPVAVVAGVTLSGLGLANTVPLLFSAAGRVPGVAPGAGVAMAATMGYGAFLVGPPAIGFVADAVGLRIALLLLVLCGLGIAVGAGRVAPPSPPRQG